MSGISSGGRVTLPVYTFTIFLSAALLFGVQPMFAKMVLPRLGGSPGVWSVAMVFFQGMLLAGYAYAHLLVSRLRPGHAVLAHLAVVACAFLFLPLAVASGWERPPESGASLWLIGLFAVSIGLPFFAVSANGPLLQAWFARTGHPHGHDPYFLYGASNLGSFAALLLYPLLLEPGLTLGGQSAAWSAGFGLLAALLALCGWIMVRANAGSGAADMAGKDASPGTAWRDRLRWMGYAFVPSGLMVAVTAHISTDVAAAPFMWVVPLALFLLTFVIVFRPRQSLFERFLTGRLTLLVITTIFLINFFSITDWLLSVSVHILTFFVCALVAHRGLYAARPGVGRLTEFYMCMSAGGVLGGIFSGLLAPALFSTVLEYPVLLVLALLCAPQVAGQRPGIPWLGAVLVVLVSVVLAALVVWAGADEDYRRYVTIAILVCALFASAQSTRPAVPVLGGVALIALAHVQATQVRAEESHRSFFGVHKIRTTPDGGHRTLFHGTTLHGAQRVADDGKRPQPLTYYHDQGPIAAALNAVQNLRPHGDVRVGAVGLGVGSLACYARPGEHWTFYEIDPVVVRIARDPALFSFLSSCGPDMEVVLGDARLTLERADDAFYDVLVIDAFSSDAIPTHLLTREAFALYARKLRPGGIVVAHISNRHMNLIPVVAAVAEANGSRALMRLHRPERGGVAFERSASLVAVVGDGGGVMPLLAENGWSVPDSAGVSPWTDDYSNILGAIIRGL